MKVVLTLEFAALGGAGAFVHHAADVSGEHPVVAEDAFDVDAVEPGGVRGLFGGQRRDGDGEDAEQQQHGTRHRCHGSRFVAARPLYIAPRPPLPPDSSRRLPQKHWPPRRKRQCATWASWKLRSSRNHRRPRAKDVLGKETYPRLFGIQHNTLSEKIISNQLRFRLNCVWRTSVMHREVMNHYGRDIETNVSNTIKIQQN